MKIKKIDTLEAEKNFAEFLDKNITIFLNGAWGSGKTEFIKNVEKILKKDFVYLDLWNVKDERTVLNTAFYKLLSIPEIILKLLVCICLMISILMTDVVNLGILSKFPFLNQEWLLSLGGIIVLFVSVAQFVKFKSDNFYAYWIKNIPFKKKILVIDDFDRVHTNKQEEAYKLFNILKGKLPIVFLGDYSRILNSDDTYLQKIIDRQVDLPYVLHPRSIWEEYFNRLEKDMKIKIEDDLRDLFVKENRNIREQIHFNEYINLEFYKRSKKGHVQENQQLLLIYLYLFHKEVYVKMLGGWHPKYNLSEEAKQRFEKYTNIDNAVFDNELEQTIDKILMSNNRYPLDYRKNNNIYYVHESVNNLSTSEAEKIIFTDNTLKYHLIKKGDYTDDFYSYIKHLYKAESSDVNMLSKNKKEEKLKYISLQLITEKKCSPLVEYIINEIYKDFLLLIQKEIINLSVEEKSKKIINHFEQNYLCNFDLSQKIHFFKEILPVISFEHVKKYYLEEVCDALKDSQVFKSQEMKPYILYIIVLNYDGSWIYPEKWQNKIREAVNNLSDNDFVLFWSLYRIINLNKSTRYYQDFKAISSITIIRGFYHPSGLEREDKDYNNILEFFEEKLLDIADEKSWKIRNRDSFESEY